MTQTLDFLRLLGSPFAESTENLLSRIKYEECFNFAQKNRMLYLFLNTISKKNLTDFETPFRRENMKYLKTIEVISKASQVLTNAGIDHAIFKTIRPYESTTVDIDIIIFGREDKYNTAFEAMQKAGYRKVVRGPQSTTLKESEIGLGIDVYDNISVSFLIYMDKEKLVNHVTTKRLPNGLFVETLKPHADLAAIIAHSIIKEQMYTLAEYYTYLEYLENINIKELIEVIETNHILHATRVHTAITALLHNAAHGFIPDKIQHILSVIGVDPLEEARVRSSGFKAPHKYHPLTVIESLIEVAKGEKSRNSIAKQIAHMLNPKIAQDAFSKLLKHSFREAY